MTDTTDMADFREDTERALRVLRTEEQANFHYAENPLSWHAVVEAAATAVMAAADPDDPAIARLRHTVAMLAEEINDYIEDEDEEDDDA